MAAPSLVVNGPSAQPLARRRVRPPATAGENHEVRWTIASPEQSMFWGLPIGAARRRACRRTGGEPLRRRKYRGSFGGIPLKTPCILATIAKNCSNRTSHPVTCDGHGG